MLNTKLILTDVDGVLLHWEWMFDIWMTKHGYNKQDATAYSTSEAYCISEEEGDRLCTMFNETVYIRNLPPYFDAIRYTRKLHEEHGYVFHAITSISSDPLVIESRVENLHRVFGRSMFFDITCLNHAVSKTTILKQYQNSKCFWIEDHLENCALGNDLGLRPLLINQTYNQTNSTSDKRYKYLHRVGSWKQIYDIITG
jgi:FMN phosphatase YigB (HAD superfamily)